jgi:hypothetical protein
MAGGKIFSKKIEFLFANKKNGFTFVTEIFKFDKKMKVFLVKLLFLLFTGRVSILSKMVCCEILVFTLPSLQSSDYQQVGAVVKHNLCFVNAYRHLVFMQK